MIPALSHIEQPLLVIGLGGLACPALAVLARSGLTHFTLVDDDAVDLGNLQRQILYTEADVGRPKVEVAAERIRALSPYPERVRCELVRDRFAPDNALALSRGHALILEGADNFATKFLAADAGRLLQRAVVQAGAVRFGGWALAALPAAGACLRCVFEDVPRGAPETCAAAGVLGPVVGVLGALSAAMVLELLLGRSRAAGVLYSYEALPGALRRHRVAQRTGCPLCGGEITDLDPGRYFGACAA